MAVEQLEDALKAYFANRYHSAIVLAGASEQLLAGYVLKHKMEPSWSQMRGAITKIANGLHQQVAGKPGMTTEKNIGDLLNRAYNHSKHAGTKDHIVLMNPKFEARELIDRCISNYDMLFARTDYRLQDIPLIQNFMHESINEVQFEDEATDILKPLASEGGA
ncbi:MAG: hypothetical protein KKA22_06470 [Gammaproteobacteria bacterium]|nr:hypothetical protein [Gammaproteobacteria bacterium]MBU1407778.1 hypothetical protein [Gammaproteobacteria bacterium]MBU1531891.1 hypothetical protein [Gammaproteobacteria bacterium]